MKPLVLSLPTAPPLATLEEQFLFASLASPSPATWHQNEDKECLWLDSLPSLHRHGAYFDEGKLILESKMF